MLNFYMLISGSKGNSTIIWDENDIIMIDAGISLKRFKEKTGKFDFNGREKSLFISHEHSDHSSSAKSIQNRLKMDVYSRKNTLEKLNIDGYSINDSAAIGNFEIIPVSVSHDAVDPVVYVVKNRGVKISVVSDLGLVSDDLLYYIKNSDILALESNYDGEMLINGKYPEHLKRRISSEYGHLSNEQTSEAISEAINERTNIILTHLSENNNTPDIAMNHVKSYLNNRNKKYRSIECASQYYGSSTYEF